MMSEGKEPDDEFPCAHHRLSSALGMILPALDQFLRHDSPETTISSRAFWMRELTLPLPMQGRSAEEILKLLRDVIIPNGLRLGPTFLGYITQGPSEETSLSLVALLCAAVAGPQREWNHPLNIIEALTLDWLAEMHGYNPSSYKGIFTSGGSIANLQCLAAARQFAGESLGIDPARVGVGGILRPRFYTSTEANSALARAIATLGCGRDALVLLPTDRAFRLDISGLRSQIEQDIASGCTPIAVIAHAGTSATGAVDPLAEIAVLCREKKIWFHIDGAYGLPGVLDARVAHLFAGHEQADSFVIDPHKWLGVPVGCGAAFVRHPDLLRRTFALGKFPVLQSTPRRADASIRSPFDSWGEEFGDYGLESSAPSYRSATVWAQLLELGVKGVRERVERHITLAQMLASKVQSNSELELMAPSTLSICCFRSIPQSFHMRNDQATRKVLDELNQRLLLKMWERGHYFPSSTTIGGAFALRACFIHPATREDIVVGFYEEVGRCAELVKIGMKEELFETK